MHHLISLLSYLDGPPSVEAIGACDEMLGSMSEAKIQQINNFRLSFVKDKRFYYVLEMVRPLRKELGLVNKPKSAPDLHTLLHLMRTPRGHGEIAVRRQFEAMEILLFACAVDLADEIEPQVQVLRDLWQMNELLERVWIDEDSETITLFSYHDPKPTADGERFRVKEGDIASEQLVRRNLLEREHPLPLRRTRSGIRFLFEQRDKDLFQVVLKIWKQVRFPKKDPPAGYDPYRVGDRRAFRIVALSVEEMRTLIGEFEETLKHEGARLVLVEDKYETNGSANPNTGRNFRNVKYMLSLGGVWFEFQFTTMLDDVNAEYAVSGENHQLYKFGQALDYYLPLLYPTFAYQTVDSWEDEALREKLRRRMIQNIGWNLDPPGIRRRKASSS